MRDFMAQQIVCEFVCRVPLDEETSGGMDPARPGLKLASGLELVPICRSFKDVNMRLGIASWCVALEFLCNDTVIKFRFNGHRCCYKAMNEMIDEMIRLAVFPLVGMNCQCLFA